ncbi:hypothetical protein ABEF92_002244 [Exophiala dermatitidis]|uniref:Uncharacterized protein n=2 Tax=Exophiala dermatitidis TaxID=5970 RepID=H6C5A4_EXODN|nr:uncharacterized protein HMPREF1120_06953 [Exophiala dermatitidis NIH/UT8656]EHY58951.1 hypothetical protein HMPREF1120_06953 [Exophiala dermatitidis NIH/UT8656]
MGIVSGLVNKPNQSAREIVDEMMTDAVRVLASAGNYLHGGVDSNDGGIGSSFGPAPTLVTPAAIAKL